jgi:hypothetical protein
MGVIPVLGPKRMCLGRKEVLRWAQMVDMSSGGGRVRGRNPGRSDGAWFWSGWE